MSLEDYYQTIMQDMETEKGSDGRQIDWAVHDLEAALSFMDKTNRTVVKQVLGVLKDTFAYQYYKGENSDGTK